MSAYLENGTFDILGMQYGLTNGVKFMNCLVKPVAYIMSVDEPEFGCEGREEGEAAYGIIHGYTLAGPRRWKIEEKVLYETGMYDQMWVGVCQYPDGREIFGCFREQTDQWSEFDPSVWMEIAKTEQQE